MAYDAEGWNGGEPSDPVVAVQLVAGCVFMIASLDVVGVQPGAVVTIIPRVSAFPVCVRLIHRSGETVCILLTNRVTAGQPVEVEFK